MKILFNFIIFLALTINSSFAENVDPVKNLLKTLTGKSLNKEQTQKFLSEFVIIIEDERGDGLVTYLFDDRNYIRYKDYEKISKGAWRFTKTGQLRVFNQDIKLTWKIQLGKNDDNKINIKPKFDPLGKLYGFNYQAKDDFLSELSDYKEQLALEKKRLEQEKIDAKKKVEEEKAKLEQEKLEAQKKAEEEKAKLEQEKLEAQKKAEEEKAKLEAEKAALEKEIAEQKKQLELEKLYIQLEPEFRRKCIKKALNDLYEVGTPEYKTCIINKGPEKQLKEAEENKIKLEQEKAKLEQKKLEVQKKVKEEKRKEKMRNRDDTSNSKLAKKLLKYQNPSCANYTFKDLFGDRLINRKWTDVQHKNYMNKKLVMLEALDIKSNENIEVVFELDYNGENGRWEIFGDPLLNKFSYIVIEVMLPKCL